MHAISQSVDGSWYGSGRVSLTGEHEQYLVELTVKTKGSSFEGYFNYYFKEGYFETPITGTYDAEHATMTINQFYLIHYASNTAKTGVETLMKGTLFLSVSGTDSIISGELTPDPEHKYTSPPVKILLKRPYDTTSFIPKNLGTEPLAGPLPVSKKDSLTPVLTNHYPAQPTAQRQKDLVQEIPVYSSSIDLEFYDNGIIDYDSITVYFNDSIVIPKSMLSDRPLRTNIKLDSNRTFNEISMFANNVGLIPPNSAVLILYDGRKRHEIQMVSDLKKSATIRVKKIKAPN